MIQLWIKNIYGEYTIMRGHFPLDEADVYYTYKLDMEIFIKKMYEFNCRFEKMNSYNNCVRFNSEEDAMAAKNWIEAQIVMNKIIGI